MKHYMEGTEHHHFIHLKSILNINCVVMSTEALSIQTVINSPIPQNNYYILSGRTLN